MVLPAGLTAHFIPEGLSTVAIGGAISSWPNEVGGPDLGGKVGTITRDGTILLNGHAPAFFDSGYMDLADLPVVRGDSTQGTLALVFRSSGSTGASEITKVMGDDGGSSRSHWSWSGTTYDRTLFSGGRTSFALDLNGANRVMLVQSGGGNVRMTVDGTLRYSRASAFPSPLDRFRVGHHTGSGYHTARYWEIMYWPRDLTSDEVAVVNGYLNSRYAFALSPATTWVEWRGSTSPMVMG